MQYKVLLIEDNTDCRELFAMMVWHLGCDVLQADDGELGVQKALCEKPDLIIMDIGLPNMNGMEALSCLRESVVTKSTPIVVYTAWVGENYRDAALKSGAHEFITKPISFEELQRVLLRYLPAPSKSADVQ
jgi:two-component system, cell cycle response regulator DivK